MCVNLGDNYLYPIWVHSEATLYWLFSGATFIYFLKKKVVLTVEGNSVQSETSSPPKTHYNGPLNHNMVVFTFEPVEEILKYDNLNESYWAVLSNGCCLLKTQGMKYTCMYRWTTYCKHYHSASNSYPFRFKECICHVFSKTKCRSLSNSCRKLK